MMVPHDLDLAAPDATSASPRATVRRSRSGAPAEVLTPALVAEDCGLASTVIPDRCPARRS
ncbi:hypothetical protein [Nocardiopsis rhodophaea]|uniref:hypothetical protein n=1 Tax=Nocardiopsis rhodophaea TaxID=280238 RepID=UPI0039F0E750